MKNDACPLRGLPFLPRVMKDKPDHRFLALQNEVIGFEGLLKGESVGDQVFRPDPSVTHHSENVVHIPLSGPTHKGKRIVAARLVFRIINTGPPGSTHDKIDLLRVELFSGDL